MRAGLLFERGGRFLHRGRGAAGTVDVQRGLGGGVAAHERKTECECAPGAEDWLHGDFLEEWSATKRKQAGQNGSGTTQRTQQGCVYSGDEGFFSRESD
jgi:hypothetical protein